MMHIERLTGSRSYNMIQAQLSQTMLNPDRAELRSQSSLIPENPRKNSHIPSWARTSVFTARTFLAVLTAAPSMVIAADTITRIQNPSVVYAADNKCSNTELDYIGVGFADDPLNEKRETGFASDLFNTNVANTLNLRDIWIGSPQFGQLVVEYAANPKDPNAKWSEVGRYKMINNGTFSLARIRLDGLDANLNESGTPLVIIRTYFEDEKDRVRENSSLDNRSNFEIFQDGSAFGISPWGGPQGPAINRLRIICGRTSFFWEGKPTSDAELEKAVRNPNFTFRRWGLIFAEFINAHKEDFKINPGSSQTSFYALQRGFSDKGWSVFQEETRQAFQKNLDSKKQVVPSPTSKPAYTPISTPAPINTPLPIGNRTSADKEATREARQEEAYVKERARLQAEYEKTHPSPTSTPRLAITPELKPTQVIPSASTPSEGIPDWLWGLGAAALASLAAFWGYERGKRKQKNPTSPPPPPPSAPHPPRSGGSNPNIGVNLGPNAASGNPNTGPAQPKNPEWIIGQKEFARRWQDVKSKLPPVRAGDTGNEQGYILDRFKTGMNMIHEISLEDTTNVPEMNTRVRAGIEHLISEIWPDNRIFKRFFDPQFNAGLLSPEDLAKIIYLPEKYRHLSSFTRAQKAGIMTIRRTLLHALHPDLLKSDSDPKLKDSLDILLKQLNAAWPLINKLIS